MIYPKNPEHYTPRHRHKGFKGPPELIAKPGDLLEETKRKDACKGVHLEDFKVL